MLTIAVPLADAYCACCALTLMPLHMSSFCDKRQPANLCMQPLNQGHEALLVGGTVRDLLLGRAPKDIDIITSALPKEVRVLFPRSTVIGQRHPIVQAELHGCKLDISSFHTNADSALIPQDARHCLQQLSTGRVHVRRHWQGIRAHFQAWLVVLLS